MNRLFLGISWKVGQEIHERTQDLGPVGLTSSLDGFMFGLCSMLSPGGDIMFALTSMCSFNQRRSILH